MSARRLHDDERGATAAIVAISLIALLGMLVLVVDLGGMLTMRRRMVAGADSAALATAQSCALGNTSEASAQADALALANEPLSTRTAFATVGCTGQSSGSASVGYQAPIELHFAPVLGLDDQTVVGARARAIWGPAGGTSPVPIEFAIDPASGVFPCAFQAVGTACNYWFDNSEDHDLTDSSNWGFMNLNAWGVAADASCPNSGTNDRQGWITGDDPSKVVLQASPTYVCVDSGHSTSSWLSALEAQIGKIKHFPINDPTQMVSTSGKQKYAIIGFAALMVEDVLKGNDVEAIGTPGDGGDCTQTNDFSVGEIFVLDDADGPACPGGAEPDTITDLLLTKKQGNTTTTFTPGVDYTYDPSTHTVTWLSVPVQNVKVEFTWAISPTPGKCGVRQSDPNAVCLVASWQGAKVGGTNPGGAGEDFGLRAIRLDE